MKVIAEGCKVCEPLVDPDGPRENENHLSARFDQDYRCVVTVDGEEGHMIHEAWLGSPGRVIEYPPSGDSVHRAQLCVCGRAPFRQLVEYDRVELIRIVKPTSERTES